MSGSLDRIALRSVCILQEGADSLLEGNPDYVLDCIDNIDTKVSLLLECNRRKLQVLCATGAGARADPTRVRIADISESAQDPLSRSVRHRLKREHGINGGVTVVLSTEKPRVALCGLPTTDSTGKKASDLSASEFQIVPGFRVRTIPVLGPLPAIFGLTMASYIVTQLA